MRRKDNPRQDVAGPPRRASVGGQLGPAADDRVLPGLPEKSASTAWRKHLSRDSGPGGLRNNSLRVLTGGDPQADPGNWEKKERTVRLSNGLHTTQDLRVVSGDRKLLIHCFHPLLQSFPPSAHTDFMSKGFENISGKGTGGGGELPEMEDIGKPAPFFGLLILAVGLPQLLRSSCLHFKSFAHRLPVKAKTIKLGEENVSKYFQVFKMSDCLLGQKEH